MEPNGFHEDVAPKDFTSEASVSKNVAPENLVPENISLEEKRDRWAPQFTVSPARPWFWGLTALVAVGGGVGVWRSLPTGSNSTTPVAQAQKGPPPRAVEITTLTAGTGQRTITLLGQVEATQQTTVRAQTGGIVEEILVQPGDRVAVGTTLAILDKADQQLALSEAQARYAQQRSELAKLEVGTRPEIIAQRQAAVTTAIAREKAAQDNLQRTLNLIREGAVAQRLVVEAQAAVDAARGTRLAAQAELTEAQAGPIREEIAAQQATVQAAAVAVNQARLSLNRTQVVASSVGVVQSRAVSQGDLVQSGGAIATLIAGDRLDIFLEVPENLTGQVTPGTPVQLTTRSLPNWKGRTTITATAPSTETASRRQRVRIQLNSPPAGLLPGMAISATITQPINRFGFLVSRDALTRRRDQWLVFAVDNDKAKQVQVEMVADMGKQVLISTPDLKAGQAIVSRGSDLLQDNSPIKVVKPQG